MKLKKLNLDNDIDKKILLSYFFKDPDTVLNKDELLKFSCICYDSKKKNLYSNTKRFEEKLKPYKNIEVQKEKVETILHTILATKFNIHEELLQCTLQTKTGEEYFFILVIGVDFFLIESQYKK